MSCFFGCIIYGTNPVTGERVWYNRCPKCNSKLDR